ncbi:hypothetical protein [uncultured Corynebacterium sp.]|uniref:trypsin-like serine protease n=1 Tax=uncultured Corynebacterium sp. TaxID=159447 RepID=UPI0025DE653C|nr:hypothetical protein [uncultured Corynebacterium sp.]
MLCSSFRRRSAVLAASLAAALTLTAVPAQALSSYGSSKSPLALAMDEVDAADESAVSEQAPAQAAPQNAFRTDDPRNTANPVATVNQGDRLQFGYTETPTGTWNNAQCTAGYVDPQNHVIYVAAHCGDDGHVVTDAAGTPVGVIRHAMGALYDRTKTWREQFKAQSGRDFAFVELCSTVNTGANTYSGDRILGSPANLAVGTEVCTYGITSGLACGRIIAHPTNDFPQSVFRTNIRRAGGDSGGPVWVKGGGYLGITLQAWEKENKSLAISAWAKNAAS